LPEWVDPKREIKMNETDYLPDPVTPTAILQTLQAAFLDAKLDDDNDVLVESFPLSFFISLRDKDIRFLVLRPVKEGTSHLAQLEFVNRVNDRLKIPRVALDQMPNGRLVFSLEWYIPCALPISKLDLVTAVRRFGMGISNLDDPDGVLG
jgi:hypothetical protein